MIVSTFPTNTKHYLKQPYRRFYKENSTDVVWSKLNRAVLILERAHKNIIASNNTSPRGLSRRQKLSEAFNTWKEEAFAFEEVDDSNIDEYYDGNNIAQRFPKRNMIQGNHYDPRMGLPEQENYGSYHDEYPEDNQEYETRNDHHGRIGPARYEYNRHDSRLFPEDGKSLYDYPSQYNAPFIPHQYSNYDGVVPNISPRGVPTSHGGHRERSDSQSVQSDASYSPDVFFLSEETSLPKSTQALKDRMQPISSNSKGDQQVFYNDGRNTQDYRTSNYNQYVDQPYNIPYDRLTDPSNAIPRESPKLYQPGIHQPQNHNQSMDTTMNYQPEQNKLYDNGNREGLPNAKRTNSRQTYYHTELADAVELSP